MFKKTPILKYESAVKEYQNIIVPSKTVIPEWFKKIPKWKDKKIFDVKTGFGQTLKLCVPFLDAMTSGYVITLPFDVYVKDNDGSPFLTWAEGADDLSPSWRELSDENLVPFGHTPIEYVWKPNVAFTVPKGYSVLLTHPLNRHDLPFTTLSGIVDGELVMQSKGNVPFYLKIGFEGIIPQGTPIAQLILFRQENWKSKKTLGLLKIGEFHRNSSLLILSGWYKKMFWVRKNYE
jgi:hypothetical protein